MESLQSPNYLYILAALFLMPLNWLVEFSKFHLIAKISEAEMSLKMRAQAFFAGMLSAFISPNMTGNFIGRIFYFKRANRLKIFYLTILSNFTQLITTLIFGLISLIIVGDVFQLRFPVIYYITAIVLIIIIYFFYENFIKIFKFKWKKFDALLGLTNSSLKVNLILISALRYFIFIAQYLLILKSFEILIDLKIVFSISLLFLFTSLTPGLFFGKLIIRESVAIWLLSLFGIPELIALYTSLIIWTLNLLLPNILILLLIKLKVK